jgi:hypothetical protein
MTRRPATVAATVAALVGLALFLVSAAGAPVPALRGWLAAAVGWAAVSLGCVIALLTRMLTGAGHDGIGRTLAVAGWTMPLTALAFAPVLWGVASIYPWATVAPEGAFRLTWLTPTFFIWRSVAYVVVWLVVALSAWWGGGRALAAVGLVAVALTGSLASVDWLMSLDPRFHSSIFGMLFLSHAALAGWAFATATTLLGGQAADPRVAAGYLLAGILLWGYMAFCQYLVVWSADEPDEIGWFLERGTGLWRTVTWVAWLLKGVLPFLLLLPARMRAHRGAVGLIAVAVLVGGLLEVAAMALPSGGDHGARPLLSAAAAALGLGGVWLLVLGHGLDKATKAAVEANHG